MLGYLSFEAEGKELKILKATIVSVMVILMLVSASIASIAEPIFFLQDDFVLTFGKAGDPWSAGTEFYADGRIMDWNLDTRLAYFVVSGKATEDAVVVGDEKFLNLNGGDTNDGYDLFEVYGGRVGKNYVNLLWRGTIDYFYIIERTDGTDYLVNSANGFDRPSRVTEPTYYEQRGYASFTATYTTSGWNYPFLAMKWTGFYNIDPDSEIPPTQHDANMQGKLVVPEFMPTIPLMTGVISLFGVLKKSRYKK